MRNIRIFLAALSLAAMVPAVVAQPGPPKKPVSPQTRDHRADKRDDRRDKDRHKAKRDDRRDKDRHDGRRDKDRRDHAKNRKGPQGKAHGYDRNKGKGKGR